MTRPARNDINEKWAFVEWTRARVPVLLMKDFVGNWIPVDGDTEWNFNDPFVDYLFGLWCSNGGTVVFSPRIVPS